MKVNEHWLKSFVDYNMPLASLADVLTQAGIEVEHIESLDAKESLEVGALASVLSLKIPPNRGDCLSVEGLAREVSAITQSPLKTLKVKPYVPSLSKSDDYPIQVLASEACPRFNSCVIRNLNNTLATPDWILDALKVSGIAPASMLIDILNYVMLELGQPFQAFDLQGLEGSLVLRKATASESIKIRDDHTIGLDSETWVIADQKNIHALAGIMGSEQSLVHPNTTAVILISAFFDPITIRQAVQRYELHSEASYRFERGIDPDLAPRALERALEQIIALTGAKAGDINALPKKEEVGRALVETSIFLERKKIQHYLGIALDDKEVISLFQRLNMQVQLQSDGFRVKPPSYRLDLKMSVDLIEELGRLYGFDRIPAVDFCGEVKAPALSDLSISERSLKDICINRGYSEIISYSFIDPIWADRFTMNTTPLRLENPISSEMAMMRSSLWPGLLTALQYNQNRQIKRARLFEMGTCFMQKEGELCEVSMLAGLCVGSVEPEQWGWTQWKLKDREHDFYDIKGDVEALLSLLGTDPISFEALEHPALQPGRSALIKHRNQKIGILGALHPRILKNLDLQGMVWVFEIERSAFVATMPSFVPLSKFPSVRRDIALLVSKAVLAQDLKQSVIASAGEWLQKVIVFDAYAGKELDAKQSIALSLVFQHPSRTLEEAEIKTLVDRVVEDLKKPPFQARLRE